MRAFWGNSNKYKKFKNNFKLLPLKTEYFYVFATYGSLLLPRPFDDDCRMLMLSSLILTKYIAQFIYCSLSTTLLLAHNWHWVSSICTHVKINILELIPWAVQMSIEKIYTQHLFKQDGIGIYKYYYLFLF